MAWILLFVGLVIVLVADSSMPLEYTAHASREKPFDGKRPMGHKLSSFNGFRLKDKKEIVLSKRTVIVRVDGDSCSDFGLFDGSKVIAELADAQTATELKRGEIVVIDGPGLYESGLRFRRFDRLDGDTMHFLADKKGLPTPRNVSQLWAKVKFRQVETASA